MKFFAWWFIVQVLLIGFCGLCMDLHPYSEEVGSVTVDCSSVSFKWESAAVDIAVPLIQFSDFIHKPCQ